TAASWSSIIAPRTACSASLLHGVWRPAYSLALSAVEEASGDTDVIPGWSLPVGVSEQGRRMIGHDDGNAAEPMNLIAEGTERLLGIEQALGGRPSHGQDDRGLHQLDLPVKKRQAGRDLVVLRQPVLRRPALHDVADEHLIARQRDRFENFGEQLAGAADERSSGLVFSAPRPLADHHQTRRGEALARHRPGAAVAQLAAATAGDERRDVLQAGGPLDGIGGKEIGRRWVEGNSRS